MLSQHRQAPRIEHQAPVAGSAGRRMTGRRARAADPRTGRAAPSMAPSPRRRRGCQRRRGRTEGMVVVVVWIERDLLLLAEERDFGGRQADLGVGDGGGEGCHGWFGGECGWERRMVGFFWVGDGELFLGFGVGFFFFSPCFFYGWVARCCTVRGRPRVFSFFRENVCFGAGEGAEVWSAAGKGSLESEMEMGLTGRKRSWLIQLALGTRTIGPRAHRIFYDTARRLVPWAMGPLSRGGAVVRTTVPSTVRFATAFGC